MIARRNFLALPLAATPLTAAFAQAAAPGQKPIRLIVPYAAGGGADNIGRQIAQQLGARLGRNVFVDNRGGAGGMIGTTEAARALPDGGTLVLTTTAIVSINPVVYKSVSYDVERDFVPVALVCESPLILVANPNLPADNAAELLQKLRQSPDQYFLASSGNGTIAHMAAMMLGQKGGGKAGHVPYNGEAAAITALMAGDQKLVYFATAAAAIPLVRSGKLKALGAPAGRRHKDLPQTATFQEQGIQGADAAFWYGLLAPAKTPVDAVTAYERALLDAFSAPQAQAALEGTGFVPIVTGREAFARQIAQDVAHYKALAQAVPVRIE